ncbi:MAG: hypothetical protein N3G75_09285, partial [Methanothrix sp.]
IATGLNEQINDMMYQFQFPFHRDWHCNAWLNMHHNRWRARLYSELTAVVQHFRELFIYRNPSSTDNIIRGGLAPPRGLSCGRIDLVLLATVRVLSPPDI